MREQANRASGFGGLAAAAIARPVATTMIFLGVALLGLLAWRQLPVQLLPDYTYPRIWVQASYPGASPDMVEQDVLEVLEGDLAALGSIEEMRSTARTGGGFVELAFEREIDLDFAAVRVEQQVARALEKMPETVFADVQRFDTSSFSNFVMELSFRGDADMETLRRLAEDVVVPRLAGVEGVVQAATLGGASKQVGVFVDPDRARAAGVSVPRVRQVLQEAARPVVAVGEVERGGQRLPVVLDGRPRRLADLAQAPVDPTGRVRLSHVADIVPGLAGSAERYRVDGLSSVAVHVYKDQQSNLIAVARRLRAHVDVFNEEQEGAGLVLSIDFDAAKVMEDELRALKERAGAGALLALLVLLVFLGARASTVVPFAMLALAAVLAVTDVAGGAWLEDNGSWAWPVALLLAVALLLRRDARAVGIVALAVPASLLLAVTLFAGAGLTLNVLSLLGLALAVGMLLDNGIVVLEAIASRRDRGDGPLEAARVGSAQVQRAVVAGTLTTLVVFVPLFLLDQELAPLFRELALAVSLPLVASLAVAVTLVPMVASRLGRRAIADPIPRWPGPGGAPRPGRARTGYSVAARLALRHPVATLGIFTAVVLGSIVAGVLTLALFSEPARPAEDRVELVAEMPEGRPIEDADDLALQLEALVEGLPEVDEVRTRVREEEASVVVVFRDRDEREAPVDLARVRARLREQVAGIGGDAVVQVDPPPEGGTGGAAGLLGGDGDREILRVSGPPGGELIDLASRVREGLEDLPGVARVRWDLASAQPTLEVRADRRRLAEVGLSTRDLMSVLWAARREGEPTRHPFRLGDEDLDIVLWVEGGGERSVADVRRFPLTSPSGARIPLSGVSTVTTGTEPPEVRRHQRARTVTIEHGFDTELAGSGQAVQAVRDAVDDLVASFRVPPGHGIDVEHADEGLSETSKLIYLALALVYIVLAITFESLVLPLLILPCVLLALAGVIWALFLTGTPVNQYVMLAGVVLLGIVVNNGILFVDRSQTLLASGVRRPVAVLRAAHDRLRPVLMTATTTVLGMLPLAVATGGQQEVWPPFGRAVIGGLVAATAISLLFVPAATLLLGHLSEMFRRLGLALSAFGVGAAIVIGWTLRESAMVESDLILWLVAPVLLLLIPTALRGVQRAWRGEGRLDLLPDEGPVELRTRRARKIYGGPARFLREWLRIERWREIAARHGLGRLELETPAEGRRALATRVGLLALFVVLLALADTAWARLLLGAPVLLLIDGIGASLALMAGRPGAWPPRGWAGRLWRVAEAAAFFTFLYRTRALDSEADALTLVLAAVLLGTWAVLHLVAVGGIGGFLGVVRKLASPPPVVALDGVDLSFGVGLHGLLGPNGAGKSTLMKLVVNLYEPSRGQVTINGHELSANGSALQRRIGYLPQFFGVPARLTARQYLHHQALLAGRLDAEERRRLVDDVLREVGLEARADEALGGYSGGMRQRVGIARTLLNVPRIVVVDEPTVGLDPRERIRFRNLLAELARTRVVLLSTHVVEDIGSACRDVVVLDEGRVLFRGSPEDLIARATGRAWTVKVTAKELGQLSRDHRIVSSSRTPDGFVEARGVGAPPDGAELVRPSLEDAYILLLGRSAREGSRAA